MKALVTLFGVWALIAGYLLGNTVPLCCPGEQRSCQTDSPSRASGVMYCRESGFGFEACQEIKEPYPQALWRRSSE